MKMLKREKLLTTCSAPIEELRNTWRTLQWMTKQCIVSIGVVVLSAVSSSNATAVSYAFTNSTSTSVRHVDVEEEEADEEVAM